MNSTKWSTEGSRAQDFDINETAGRSIPAVLLLELRDPLNSRHCLLSHCLLKRKLRISASLQRCHQLRQKQLALAAENCALRPKPPWIVPQSGMPRYEP